MVYTFKTPFPFEMISTYKHFTCVVFHSSTAESLCGWNIMTVSFTFEWSSKYTIYIPRSCNHFWLVTVCVDGHHVCRPFITFVALPIMVRVPPHSYAQTSIYLCTENACKYSMTFSAVSALCTYLNMWSGRHIKELWDQGCYSWPSEDNPSCK